MTAFELTWTENVNSQHCRELTLSVLVLMKQNNQGPRFLCSNLQLLKTVMKFFKRQRHKRSNTVNKSLAKADKLFECA